VDDETEAKEDRAVTGVNDTGDGGGIGSNERLVGSTGDRGAGIADEEEGEEGSNGSGCGREE
jgi:hypothetical protein